MDIICDRFDVCRSKLLDRGEETENVARAKGWHIWRGPTITGKDQEVILCDKCVDAGRRMLKKVEALPGQYPIPQLQVIRVDDGALSDKPTRPNPARGSNTTPPAPTNP